MSKFIKSSRRPGAQEAAKIRTTFQHFDEDKDGGICMPEFVKMLSDLGIHLSDGDREELFKEMDLDKSGKIDLVEFLDHYYTLLSLSEVCRFLFLFLLQRKVRYEQFAKKNNNDSLKKQR